MKKRLLPLLLAAFTLMPQASHASSKEMFMSLVFVSSARHADDIQLYTHTSGSRGPVVDFKRKYFVTPKRSFLLNSLKGFTFHMEVVSGVRDILSEEENKPFPVYSIDGRMVRPNAISLEGLPQGIYIVKGKKYIVK